MTIELHNKHNCIRTSVFVLESGYALVHVPLFLYSILFLLLGSLTSVVILSNGCTLLTSLFQCASTIIQLLLLATMTLNQVQSFRINHQAGSHYINI